MRMHIEAQQFLLSTQKGVLSTHSATFTDYPFGSVTPFVVNHQGMPVILISNLAEHTKNIIQNAHVSLLVFNDEADLQAGSRLTLLATAEQTDKNNSLIRARYLRYIPQAASYFDMHDFMFYTLHITHARYIAGFGKMGWVQGEAFHIPTHPLLIEEADILHHMNTDHSENLKAYCLHYHQVVASTVTMIGIDAFGFDVRVNHQQQLRFTFTETISNAQEARAALVAMAKTCRV
jgi:heme iron utilization protein